MNYVFTDLLYFLFTITILIILQKIITKKKILYICFIFSIYINNYIMQSSTDLSITQTLNLFILDTSYLLIYFEMISILERGYSLNILRTIYEYKDVINLKNADKLYSNKKGLKWLYEKRINSMNNLRLITIEDNKIKLTKRGYIIAIFLNIFSKIFITKRNL